MELIFLLLGIGLGFVGSKVTHSFKKPVVSKTSLPQGTGPYHIQPPRENIEPPQENIEPPQEEQKPLQEEPKPLQVDIEPIKEELKQTQLAYEMAKEMSQFKGGFWHELPMSCDRL